MERATHNALSLPLGARLPVMYGSLDSSWRPPWSERPFSNLLDAERGLGKQTTNKWANRTSGKVGRLFFFFSSSSSSYSYAIASNLAQTQYALTVHRARERFLFCFVVIFLLCCRQPSGCVSFVLFFLLRRWLLQPRSVRVSLSLSLSICYVTAKRDRQRQREEHEQPFIALCSFSALLLVFILFFFRVSSFLLFSPYFSTPLDWWDDAATPST